MGRHELRECPFCGSADIWLQGLANDPMNVVGTCNGCGVEGPTGSGGDNVATASADAAERWNRRTSPPAAPGVPCPTCKGAREVLWFYRRGPGDLPGNMMVPCPRCSPRCERTGNLCGTDTTLPGGCSCATCTAARAATPGTAPTTPSEPGSVK